MSDATPTDPAGTSDAESWADDLTDSESGVSFHVGEALDSTEVPDDDRRRMIESDRSRDRPADE